MAKRRSAARTTTSRKKTARKSAKRERLNTGTDKRYVRRTSSGRFDESDDVGRATAADNRRKARTKSKRGQGDRGDREPKR